MTHTDTPEPEPELRPLNGTVDELRDAWLDVHRELPGSVGLEIVRREEWAVEEWGSEPAFVALKTPTPALTPDTMRVLAENEVTIERSESLHSEVPHGYTPWRIIR